MSEPSGLNLQGADSLFVIFRDFGDCARTLFLQNQPIADAFELARCFLQIFDGSTDCELKDSPAYSGPEDRTNDTE